MNRILFESSEIADGVATCSDARAEHILSVLHGEVGQTLKTGEIDGRIGTGEIVAIDGPTVRIRVSHDTDSLQPWCDLVLAPPRPRVMKRLLPQLATLGVGTIVLVGAKKVEKDFWGATLLKEENFRRFVTDELDALFPTSNRIVGHPGGASGSSVRREGRLLLAVGPEGGWTDDEVDLLESRGFSRYSLGERILRTDTALVALLSRFM